MSYNQKNQIENMIYYVMDIFKKFNNLYKNTMQFVRDIIKIETFINIRSIISLSLSDFYNKE